MSLRIEIYEPEGLPERAECAVCLLKFDSAPVMARIYGGEDGDCVYLAGFVCPSCLHGGSDGMANFLRNRAESERRAAAQLDKWANEGIEVPTGVEALIRSEDPLFRLAGKPPRSDKTH